MNEVDAEEVFHWVPMNNAIAGVEDDAMAHPDEVPRVRTISA